jgi:tRNA dimethylallyltransferase
MIHAVPSKKSKLVILLGPTASGKTAWGIALAKRFNGEIISADSRQVYRGMDIGTAKDTSFPQHLIDIIDPNTTMSVAEYKALAVQKIHDIASQDKVPFLVGGTAQYLYALVDNWDIPEVPPQKDIRTVLEAKSLAVLQAELQKKDPDALLFLDPKNKRRLVRALEVIAATGQPFSKQRKKSPPLFDMLLLGIDVPREELNRRIDTRVDDMIRQGLVDEVRQLAARYGWDAPGMNGIGYRQFKEYTEGKEILAEAIFRLKHDTRDVAKRQMTWFRKDKNIHWLHTIRDAESFVQSFLSS